MGKENNQFGTSIATIIANVFTEDNIKNYILGTKKNGSPRAVYDIIKDTTECSGTKKKKKKKNGSSYDVYLGVKKKKKKKKGKKGHGKTQWYID